MLRVLFFAVTLSSILVLFYEANGIKEHPRLLFNITHSGHIFGCQCSHESIVENFFKQRNSWRLSKLGAKLYKNEYPSISKEKTNRTFEILIWQFYTKLALRHILRYGHKWHDPLSGCSVKNCKFTGQEERMNSADAVIVHLQRGLIPPLGNRNPKQRWIFLNDESPKNAFSLAYQYNITIYEHGNIKDLYNIFNWSMTYKSDADVPVPYGRTVARKVPKYLSLHPPIFKLVPYWRRKKKLIAILMSNCVKSRVDIVKKLMQHVEIDFYGQCGDTYLRQECVRHFDQNCKSLSRYFFYLALEGAKCKEYMTEKIFFNAYSKGAIPIIQGPSIQDCVNLLPPNSYLHLDNYATIEDLAKDIIKISAHTSELLSYHKWRNHFEILNEHGYFGTKSYHFCRVCEAMNYNDDMDSVYNEDRLRDFLDVKKSCRRYNTSNFN